jgi:hypothetical protein
MNARRNSDWIGRVRKILSEGYGCEDIAEKTQRPLKAVQAEITILRTEGELERIYAAPMASGFFTSINHKSGGKVALKEA